MIKYYTNSSVTDEAFTGLTLASAEFDAGGEQISGTVSEGNPFFGYAAKEITKEEYDKYVAIFADPAKHGYELGIFGNGLLDKKTHGKMLEKQAEAQKQHLHRQVEAAQQAYERAARIAALTEEDPMVVLKDLAPALSKEVLVQLQQNNV